ncbi:MAG TPA: TlpA disulfide reductase family protein [Blastocatellia bacterium]|nr:TlpA disulfide reductase family protein [Blastocatellia bacterium]
MFRLISMLRVRVRRSKAGSFVTFIIATLFLGALIITCSGQQTRFSTESKSVAAPSQSQDDKKDATKPQPAPDFTLKDGDGHDVKLSSFKGKVVLLDFWATWCGPCRVTIPELNELSKQYQGKDVVILGVSLDEDGWTAIKTYTAKQSIDYPIVLSTPDVTKLYDDYIDALPTALIIDREGKIRQKFEGITNKEDFEKQIKDLL